MISIRPMTASDEAEVLSMMRTFYASPAVQSTPDEAVLRRDLAACVGDMPLLHGYILESDGAAAGYAMVSPGYSTEAGGPSPWIEDIYLKEEYRGLGAAELFFRRLRELYPDAVSFRLQVEPENRRAIRAYEKSGFETLAYGVMAKQN